MFKRLKNLYKLSEYEPRQEGQEVILKKETEDRPKGKAKIVSMDDPLSRIFEK